MPRINLLYVVTKLELGGAQKQLLTLIRGLDRKRFCPFLFTAQEGLLLAEALSIDELTVIKSRCLERPINPLKDLLALLEIRHVIQNNGIKVVHTHSSKAGILGRWAARFSGVEVILHTVHGWSFHDYQLGLVQSFCRWLERLTARFTDRIIVVSEHDRRKGLDNRIGSSVKYAFIRYGIDHVEFSGAEGGIRQELGIPEKGLLVGMVACFKPQKRAQDFIRLASLVRKRLPGIRFVLIGDGIMRRRLEKMVCRSGLSGEITLCGWRRDIPRILSAIDVFVLTSLWEGLPVTVLEAMTSGKPVVVSDTGGVREVVRDGQTGFLFLPKDVPAASERLCLLLKDQGLRRRMGTEAKRELGERFSARGMIEETQGLYSELCRKKGVVRVC